MEGGWGGGASLSGRSAGAGPGFFLGGGALVRNGITDFFFAEPVVLESRRSSQGAGGVHPLQPPPRSAPGVIVEKSERGPLIGYNFFVRVHS